MGAARSLQCELFGIGRMRILDGYSNAILRIRALQNFSAWVAFDCARSGEISRLSGLAVKFFHVQAVDDVSNSDIVEASVKLKLSQSNIWIVVSFEHI